MTSIVQNFRHLLQSIKQNGGLYRSVLQLYRVDEIKEGEYVGTDRNGNRYYQNKRFFVGRSRWVIYNEKYGMDYDGTHVDPEWHGWLHYVRDDPPTIKNPITYKWVDPNPQENKTGTPQNYVPYTTVKPKVEAWVPKSNKQ
ncbi:NADH dehydrogenase [ubiquinone] 1 alpha subcomplex subunit 12 [Brachionus plicatilis]|uniref:NADH dehydrogenase [ubiquinone] 1 alpha subcomplex subunit 12 n=1 Tax=Brachionus plicatilis TaxID=10195 RepID=A0A3M7RYD4_BRAPC|nr:NADH dehydrogenase [ubiquinone] 1 alpha subcomplex subunit 12 [Brachionus plicatilis]